MTDAAHGLTLLEGHASEGGKHRPNQQRGPGVAGYELRQRLRLQQSAL